MAAISLTLAVAAAAAALCFLLPSPPLPSADAADLAIEVCRKTIDFEFCRAAVYSDSHASGADRYELIDIIFRLAYRAASDTRDFIAGQVKSGGGAGLHRCLDDYNRAVQTLGQVLNDLNSESYYDLDSRSLEVQNEVNDCDKGAKGRSAVTQRNQNMLKYASMCYAVSKLF